MRSPTASSGCRPSYPTPRLVASRSTSSSSRRTSRCCSTPGRERCSRLVAEAVARVLPVESLRWITFGHVEADECGSMNEWLAAAPTSTVAHGVMGNLVSLNDLADRPPRGLADGEVLDLGGKQVRHIDTPHVPHGWEARLLFEESTSTMFCGDLITQTGDGPASTDSDLIGLAMQTEAMFSYTSSAPRLAATARKLADLSPQTLACMHGSSFIGDGGQVLRGLADAYDEQYPPTDQGRSNRSGRRPQRSCRGADVPTVHPRPRCGDRSPRPDLHPRTAWQWR